MFADTLHYVQGQIFISVDLSTLKVSNKHFNSELFISDHIWKYFLLHISQTYMKFTLQSQVYKWEIVT